MDDLKHKPITRQWHRDGKTFEVIPGTFVYETNDALLYEAAVRVHVNLHIDQKFHYATLFVAALMLAWK